MTRIPITKDTHKNDIKIGDRFGHLIVTGISRGHKPFSVQCDCGKATHKTRGALLRSPGSRKVCGRSCSIRSSEQIEMMTIHGKHSDPIYLVWRNMKCRCYNTKNKEYKRYGGRGIRVCDRWVNSFNNFLKDMANGFSASLRIDRIDPNGDYTPENCRWVTPEASSNNRRDNVFTNTRFGRLTISQLSRVSGISYSTLRGRVNAGLCGDVLIAPSGTYIGKRGFKCLIAQ